MRTARIKAEGAGYYHCLSRIIERRHLFDPAEKKRFLDLLRRLAAFSGIQVLAYALLDNHFHLLLYVPQPRPVSDEELLQRLAHLYSPAHVRQVAHQLQDLRAQGLEAAAEALKARYTRRMFDLSEFFKALKQRFSTQYNRRHHRCGPLWEQRFKSLLLEGSPQALLTVAAYIDLNPVRAGLVHDPKDYRWSSYGAAVGGCPEARQGLTMLLGQAVAQGAMGWDQAQGHYRQWLYIQGAQRGVDAQGGPLRSGFTPEQVQQVLAEGGQLPRHELLRCRVRYFSDGLALGSRQFVDRVFDRYRARFGPRRQTGARPMRFGDWLGLCTLRDLRLKPVSRS